MVKQLGWDREPEPTEFEQKMADNRKLVWRASRFTSIVHLWDTKKFNSKGYPVAVCDSISLSPKVLPGNYEMCKNCYDIAYNTGRADLLGIPKEVFK